MAIRAGCRRPFVAYSSEWGKYTGTQEPIQITGFCKRTSSWGWRREFVTGIAGRSRGSGWLLSQRGDARLHMVALPAAAPVR